MNIICVKWGDLYSAEYVNRLYRMVRRFTDKHFDFYCYTEDSSGLIDEVNIIPMPDDGLEGYWPKLRMFEKGFGGLEGRCVYFDLDIIIHNNLDRILEYPMQDLTIIKAYWKEGLVTTYKEGMLPNESYNMDINSSVLVWEAGAVSHIWEHFWEDPDYYMTKYLGIDRFIYHEHFKLNHFPVGWVYSRLFGIRQGDRMDVSGEQLQNLFYNENGMVCIYNTVYSYLKEEHRDEKILYDGFEDILEHASNHGTAI